MTIKTKIMSNFQQVKSKYSFSTLAIAFLAIASAVLFYPFFVTLTLPLQLVSLAFLGGLALIVTVVKVYQANLKVFEEALANRDSHIRRAQTRRKVSNEKKVAEDLLSMDRISQAPKKINLAALQAIQAAFVSKISGSNLYDRVLKRLGLSQLLDFSALISNLKRMKAPLILQFSKKQPLKLESAKTESLECPPTSVASNAPVAFHSEEERIEKAYLPVENGAFEALAVVERFLKKTTEKKESLSLVRQGSSWVVNFNAFTVALLKTFQTAFVVKISATNLYNRVLKRLDRQFLNLSALASNFIKKVNAQLTLQFSNQRLLKLRSEQAVSSELPQTSVPNNVPVVFFQEEERTDEVVENVSSQVEEVFSEAPVTPKKDNFDESHNSSTLIIGQESQDVWLDETPPRHRIMEDEWSENSPFHLFTVPHKGNYSRLFSNAAPASESAPVCRSFDGSNSSSSSEYDDASKEQAYDIEETSHGREQALILKPNLPAKQSHLFANLSMTQLDFKMFLPFVNRGLYGRLLNEFGIVNLHIKYQHRLLSINYLKSNSLIPINSVTHKEEIRRPSYEKKEIINAESGRKDGLIFNGQRVLLPSLFKNLTNSIVFDLSNFNFQENIENQKDYQSIVIPEVKSPSLPLVSISRKSVLPSKGKVFKLAFDVHNCQLTVNGIKIHLPNLLILTGIGFNREFFTSIDPRTVNALAVEEAQGLCLISEAPVKVRSLIAGSDDERRLSDNYSEEEQKESERYTVLSQNPLDLFLTPDLSRTPGLSSEPSLYIDAPRQTVPPIKEPIEVEIPGGRRLSSDYQWNLNWFKPANISPNPFLPPLETSGKQKLIPNYQWDFNWFLANTREMSYFKVQRVVAENTETLEQMTTGAAETYSEENVSSVVFETIEPAPIVEDIRSTADTDSREPNFPRDLIENEVSDSITPVRSYENRESSQRTPECSEFPLSAIAVIPVDAPGPRQSIGVSIQATVNPDAVVVDPSFVTPLRGACRGTEPRLGVSCSRLLRSGSNNESPLFYWKSPSDRVWFGWSISDENDGCESRALDWDDEPVLHQEECPEASSARKSDTKQDNKTDALTSKASFWKAKQPRGASFAATFFTASVRREAGNIRDQKKPSAVVRDSISSICQEVGKKRDRNKSDNSPIAKRINVRAF